MASATAPAPTGIDLRTWRTYRRLTVRSVAAAAGLSRQRISAIEATDRPTRAAVARYLEAVERAARER